MWSEWTNLMSNVNWVAILVASAATFALGSVWYAQSVFGKKWMKLVGLNKESASKDMAKTFGGGFVVTVIAAWGVAVLQQLITVNGWMEGATFGLFLGLTLVATNSLMNFMYEGRSLVLWKINTGYAVIGLAVISAVLTLW